MHFYHLFFFIVMRVLCWDVRFGIIRRVFILGRLCVFGVSFWLWWVIRVIRNVFLWIRTVIGAAFCVGRGFRRMFFRRGKICRWGGLLNMRLVLGFWSNALISSLLHSECTNISIFVISILVLIAHLPQLQSPLSLPPLQPSQIPYP